MIEIVLSFISGIIIKSLYDLLANVKVTKSFLTKKVEQYFQELDLNDDDKLSLIELIKYLRKELK